MYLENTQKMALTLPELPAGHFKEVQELFSDPVLMN